MKHQRSIRIIGGKWRGRKVSFINRHEIRPTGDRIRETLFNWLVSEINGASCLDLFAGSGSLGIEALSRGAATVTFVEDQRDIATNLEQNLIQLAADNFFIRNTDAVSYLNETDLSFDLIFLDPPFDQGYLKQAIDIIARRRLSRGYIYVESESDAVFTAPPDNCDIYRHKSAGRVTYGLITIS